MNPELIMKMMGNVNPELNKLLKRAEKHFIKTYLAPQMKSKAQQNKTQVQQHQKQTQEQLTQQSYQFEKNFYSNAKGKWVDRALTIYSQNQEKLKDI